MYYDENGNAIGEELVQVDLNKSPQMQVEREPLKVTSMDQLRSYRTGKLVELPPFADGQPFVARLRRPSLLALCKNGKIPNSLLGKAQEMFDGKVINRSDNGESMKQVFEVMDVLCEATFVEPTYKELVENDIELSDDQYMFVFSYSQTGVQALETFRDQ
jgi:hypothetical protein